MKRFYERHKWILISIAFWSFVAWSVVRRAHDKTEVQRELQDYREP
jgi:hypothetical protein